MDITSNGHCLNACRVLIKSSDTYKVKLSMVIIIRSDSTRQLRKGFVYLKSHRRII